MYQKLSVIACSIALCLMLAACGSRPPPLVATDIIITAPLPGRSMSAAYLTLTNNTDADIKITKVASAQFKSAEIHESSVEQGVAKMRRIAELAIPAKSSVQLKPGATHIMLMHPTNDSAEVSISFFDDDKLLLGVQAPFSARTH